MSEKAKNFDMVRYFVPQYYWMLALLLVFMLDFHFFFTFGGVGLIPPFFRLPFGEQSGSE
jgi:hypothetical protein